MLLKLYPIRQFLNSETVFRQLNNRDWKYNSNKVLNYVETCVRTIK